MSEIDAAAARLREFLYSDDPSHFGQHERDIETLLMALWAAGVTRESQVEG